MRTFGFSLGAVSLAALVAAPSLANAQQNGHRSLRHAAMPSAARSAAVRCSSDCGSYSLAVVSALLPVATPGSTSDVVTLVIENRGTAPAPVSLVSVAPQNHLAAAHRSMIPALAPGERTTVQLAVATGPDGTQCISITMTPAPAADAGVSHFLASAIPELDNGAGAAMSLPVWSALPDLPYWPDLPNVAVVPDNSTYAEPGEFFPFDAYGTV